VWVASARDKRHVLTRETRDKNSDTMQGIERKWNETKIIGRE
jgi:hypothetical protein